MTLTGQTSITAAVGTELVVTPGQESAVSLQPQPISSIPVGTEVEETLGNVPLLDANLPTGDHTEDINVGQHREEEEENQDIIEVSNDEKDLDREVPPEYTIHRARIAGLDKEMGSADAGGFAPKHLPFRFD